MKLSYLITIAAIGLVFSSNCAGAVEIYEARKLPPSVKSATLEISNDGVGQMKIERYDGVVKLVAGKVMHKTDNFIFEVTSGENKALKYEFIWQFKGLLSYWVCQSCIKGGLYGVNAPDESGYIWLKK